ncbi:MAG: TrmB family transcriptional regulator [Nitrosopumilus sp.]|nr:TrmB family transcriptional regulator [Nitrosopumilus sp.]
MEISDKAKKSMESLGLTNYEIRVYTTLLDSGASTAAEISKKSRVPYSKIYDVLNSLYVRGWTYSDNLRPQNFLPKSPSSAVEAMIIEMENSIRGNRNIIVNELMPIYEKTGLKEKPEIWVVSGLYNIASKITEIIQSTKEELLIAIPKIPEAVIKSIQPFLRELFEKGVKIIILASEETSEEIIKSMSRVAEIRLKNSMFGGGVIGDSKQVLILLGEGKNDYNNNYDIIAIWAEHIGLASFAKDYFKYLWEDGNKIEREY